jgi:SAM-dependent methyltransferase
MSSLSIKCIVCRGRSKSGEQLSFGKYFQCQDCGSVFLPSLSLDSDFYDADYLAYSSGRTNISGKVATFNGYLDRVEKYAEGDGRRLLDVGCGVGLMLDVASARGWDVVGVEISDHARSVARSKGHRVMEALEYVQHLTTHEQQFDLISLLDVIEHVTDPVNFIKKVSQLLRPGGIIIIAAPFANSISRVLMGRLWPHYKREHVVFMDVRVIIGSLLASGFSVIECGRNWKVVTLSYLGRHLEIFGGKWVRGLGAVLRFFAITLSCDASLHLPSGERLLIVAKPLRIV